jgi:transcriptional regulator with XRE-family HTH domain
VLTRGEPIDKAGCPHSRYMDDVRIGNAAWTIRRRKGLRQIDVAGRAGVAHGCISKFERGQLAHLRVATIRQIARALEMEIVFEPRWRGGELARLRDAGHAALVERCIAILEQHGWEVVPEYTFNHFGDRGSVDVLAWHARHRALLIVEAKSRLVDLQDLVATLHRKRRVVPRLVTDEHGWHARHIGVLVFADGRTANRTVVTRHAATFGAAFPTRANEARRWLAAPAGPLAGLWLVDTRTRPGLKGRHDA